LARKLVAGEDSLLHAGANVNYMTRRALIGDELVLSGHVNGTRQVVSLGAGMDSRAFRLGLSDTTFFEVDKQALFDVKEPLVAENVLQASSRHLVVGTIGQMDLPAALRAAGHDSALSTTWLMEGLAPYLTVAIMNQLAKDVGALSAPGSSLWLDGFSQTSVEKGMYFHGVKFESGLDNYDELWLSNGFDFAQQIDMTGVYLDGAQKIQVDPRYIVTATQTRGHNMCLMARATKSAQRCPAH